MTSKETAKQQRAALGLLLFFGLLGILLLVSGLHMTLTGDNTAYSSKMTAHGLVRNEVGPSFLYLAGSLMLALGLGIGGGAFRGRKRKRTPLKRAR